MSAAVAGPTFRPIALLHHATGRDLLKEAEALLQSCGAQLEEARALTAHGAALRRANQRAAARQPLRRGLQLAHCCGSRVLEQQCPHRADGDRGAAATRLSKRRGGADAWRAAGRADGGGGDVQRSDRTSAICDAEDRRDAPQPRLLEARAQLAHSAPSRAGDGVVIPRGARSWIWLARSPGRPARRLARAGIALADRGSAARSGPSCLF